MRLGWPRSRGGQNSVFLKDYDGCTRVIKCHDCDLIHDVVEYGGWDIYATLHGHILDLSGTLLSQGVSDNDTIRISCRLRGGSNNTDIPGQWQCANCDATRCWPVRRNCYSAELPVLTLLLLLPLGILVRVEGAAKALLAETPCLIVPPRGPPGAVVGTLPGDADSSALPGDLLGALKLLRQSSPRRTSPSMRKWWRLF